MCGSFDDGTMSTVELAAEFHSPQVLKHEIHMQLIYPFPPCTKRKKIQSGLAKLQFLPSLKLSIC